MANNVKLFLKFIAQNPFRVLGVYTNTQQKDILANANKIKAFSKVGKKIEFPLDNLPDYPPVVRNVETVNAALKSLDFDAERFKASLFWFSNLSPLDLVSLNYIAAGEVNKAISIWSKFDSLSSIRNRTIAAAINNDWGLFSTSASLLFDKFSKQICEEFGAKKDYSSEELVKIFLNELGANNPLIINELYKVCPKTEFLNSVKPENGDVEIYYLENETRRMKYTYNGDNHVINIDQSLSDVSNEYLLTHRDEFVIVNGDYLMPCLKVLMTSPAWVDAIYNILGESLIAKAEALITEIRAIDKHNGEARKRGAERLLELFREQYFSQVLENGLEHVIRGKIVKEALNCVIDFYNNADNQDEIAEEACQLALQIRIQSRFTVYRNRAQENYIKLKEHVSKLPPKEIRYYQGLLEPRIDKYNNEPSTIGNALKFIKDCAPYLMSIKGIIGENHDYYIKVSTQVAAAVVSDVIDDFNKQSSDILLHVNVLVWERSKLLEQFKALVITAATALYQLTFFGMDDDFKNQRFQKNYDIIKKQAIECGAITPIDIKYSVVVEINGKYKSCSKFEDFLPEIDSRDEKGYFDTCKTVDDCNNYLSIFPDGQFASQIGKKIEICKFNSCSTIAEIDKFISEYPNTKCDLTAKREAIVFNSCKSIYEYQIYLNKYPSGSFVSQAKERIDDLRFRKCSGKLDYIKYLSDYPNGKHNLEAYSKIDDIEFKECSTIEHFERYLRNHPSGRHVEEVRIRIEELKLLECNDKETLKAYLDRNPTNRFKTLAIKKMDNLDFSACVTISDLENFISSHPQSYYLFEAKNKLESLFWKSCIKYGNSRLYKKYIETFPHGVHIRQAKESLSKPTVRIKGFISEHKLWTIIIILGIVITSIIFSGAMFVVSTVFGLVLFFGGVLGHNVNGTDRLLCMKLLIACGGISIISLILAVIKGILLELLF